MPHKPTKVPAFIAPQLPVLSAEPPAGTGWIHAGFRTLLRLMRAGASITITKQARITVEPATAEEAQQPIAYDLDVDPSAYDCDLNTSAGPPHLRSTGGCYD